jgi:hypothetical protein
VVVEVVRRDARLVVLAVGAVVGGFEHRVVRPRGQPSTLPSRRCRRRPRGAGETTIVVVRVSQTA